MTKNEVIKTNKAPNPGGWYSQAIKSPPFVFLAGCVATDPNSGELVAPGDIVAQTKQVLENMAAILEASGASLSDVVKTTVFLKDIGEFSQFNEVYKTYFPESPPARSTIQVGDFMEGMCIEIEAIARVSD